MSTSLGCANGTILADRRNQSEVGLSQVRAAVAELIAPIVNGLPLAIYVTGSFGRLEARFPKGSDLDLFFLYGPDNQDSKASIARLQWFELAGELIRIARDLDFEPFSRDGEYLREHNVWYIGKELGSQHEDSENGFTARLLLLLESRYVFDEALYDKLIERTIGFYFGDYPPNRETFRPMSLLNDILRFWRTLCLNYEHKRNHKRSASDSEEEQTKWRAASAVDNLKLRYSRLSTCYSMVAALAAEPTPVTPERVKELCAIAPSDRWAIAAGDSEQAQAMVDELLSLYEEFLAITADADALIERLRGHDERVDVRRDAKRFGVLVSSLLLERSDTDQLRVLLV